jgi:hypothetical protein
VNSISYRSAWTVASLSLCIVLAPRLQADCGLVTNHISGRSRLAPPPPQEAQPEATPNLAASPIQTGVNNSAEVPIAGLWLTTFTSGGQVADVGFDQWNLDGTEILNDDPPPQTGNVCLGVFVKSALSTYKLKHPSWTFDASGNVNGTAIIRELIFMDPGGNTYHGTFTVDIYDLSGTHLSQVGGTLTATRITVDF